MLILVDVFHKKSNTLQDFMKVFLPGRTALHALRTGSEGVASVSLPSRLITWVVSGMSTQIVQCYFCLSRSTAPTSSPSSRTTSDAQRCLLISGQHPTEHSKGCIGKGGPGERPQVFIDMWPAPQRRQEGVDREGRARRTPTSVY